MTPEPQFGLLTTQTDMLKRIPPFATTAGNQNTSFLIQHVVK